MPDQYQWVQYPGFGGGLNNNQSASEIVNDEVADIVNFEFDLSDNLKARNGFQRQNTGNDFSSRITSIFNFVKADGTSNIIVTSGSDIFKDTSGTYSSIKGAVTFDSNTLWQWVTFNDLAIGVNRSAGATDDIIKWSGTGNVAALALTGITGTPTEALFIEVFNNRLWIIFKSHPNRLYYSSLGNPEDWSTTGGFIEIGYNDGDKITGIKAHRKNLFIFKRLKVYQLSTGVGGKVNTDAAGWNVDILTSDGGCLSAFTIRALANDLIFLSDEGLVSIAAVQEFGEFALAIISRKIKELAKVNNNIDSFYGIVNSSKSQYILAAPKLATGTINNVLYVLDYKRVGENKAARWTKFESTIINPSVLAIVLVNGRKTLFLGGDSPLYYICKVDESTYNDNGQVITKTFLSKAYLFDNQLERKQVNRVGVKISFTKKDFSTAMNVRFNESNKLKNAFSLSLPNTIQESLWDTAVWNVDSFALSSTNTQIITRKLADFKRGNSVQVEFINQQLDQDIVVRSLGFEVELLTQQNA